MQYMIKLLAACKSESYQVGLETFQVAAVVAWKKSGSYTTKICHGAFRAGFGEIRVFVLQVKGTN